MPEIHKPFQGFAVRYHFQGGIGSIGIRFGGDRFSVLRSPVGNQRMAVQQGRDLVPLFPGGVIQSGNGIVMIDLIVLQLHDGHDGIPQAEGSDNERRAAADTGYCHPEAFLIAEEVAQGDFVVEGEPPPEGGDAFQQNAPSHGRGFGTHELGRHSGKGTEAGSQGRQGDGTHRRQTGRDGGSRFQAVIDGAEVIDDLPGGAR